MRRRLFQIFAVFVLLATFAPASTIIMGGDDTVNVFPLVRYAAGHEYQQMFTGFGEGMFAVLITDIAFASVGGPELAYPINITMGLGSAFAEEPNYSHNKGFDFATVYTGVTMFTADGIGPQADGYDLWFHLDNPYLYTPAITGVLLLDIVANSGINGFVPLRAGSNDPNVTRGFDLSGSGATAIDGLGLQAKIVFTEVIPETPEPVTLVLVGGAFLVGGFRLRRGKTAS